MRPSSREAVSSGGRAARGAGRPQTELHVRPSLAVTRDQISEEASVLLASIQRRHILKLLAAGRHEDIAILHLEFFERLQAVDGETGTNHGNAPIATAGQLFEHSAGVWF